METTARLRLGEALGDRVLKVNHAGEHGAVNIYRGQRFACRWRSPDLLPGLREFQAHEARHRDVFAPPKGHPDVRGARHLFYARAGEAWRIDAFIMMMFAAAKAGWSEGFERLEGSLLGYEEWQTDAHLERLRASPHAKKFLLAAKTYRIVVCRDGESGKSE